MVEFRTMYYGPMDREYHQAITEAPPAPSVEEPIFPISQMGETVPEQDPTGRFKNIIQSAQAAIRGGAGTIQLILMTPMESAIGGRPKAYGKEVREALKEVALASNVNIAGVELPTSMNNLAGFDYQQLVFSDDKRAQSLGEVKDAIRFAADVGRGGGVDIVSWEFPRGINEAPWQKTDPLSQNKFEQVGEQRIGWLVDDRTGRTVQFRKDEIQHIPFKKETFEPIRPGVKELGKPGALELHDFTWEDFKKWAEHNKERNKQLPPEQKEPETPEEIYVKVQLQGQINSLLGWRTTYAERAQEFAERMETAKRRMEDVAITEQEKKMAKEEYERYKSQYEDYLNTAHGQQQQANELKERIRHLRPIEDYAFQRSARTYAEAGIEAMRATTEGRAKGTVTKDVYVGPEIGWPGYFGSHPDEFINLVKSARKEMVNLITKPTMKVPDPVTGEKEIKNPYWDPTVRPEQAEELAKRHVKGMFDTSHMGMWLAHFKPITDPKTGKLETEERRLERFNKWYTEEVEKIAKAGVVG
ncbi:hypothetical protein KY319_03380, partial [Candidatus Woesearchaeota archaeon]|nr:hypothetical protein [Candidatus Woesearchaeota archaeon]